MIARRGRRFYVYICFRPNGIPCYIGKGKEGRAFESAQGRNGNKHLSATVRRAGGEIPVVILSDSLLEKEAFALEVQLIKAIGRKPNGPLVNLTDGGEGPAGRVQPAEERAHRGKKSQEAFQRPEVKSKHSASLRRYYSNPEARHALGSSIRRAHAA